MGVLLSAGRGLLAAVIAVFCSEVGLALVAPAGIAAADAPAPALSVSALPEVVLGGAVLNSATIDEGANPTGEITFTLYGPDDESCSKGSAFKDTQTVAGNGVYDSGLFIPTEAGNYRWTVSYSGDTQNGDVQSGCGAADQSLTVFSALDGGGTATATATATTVTPGFNEAQAPASNYIGNMDGQVVRIWTAWCSIETTSGNYSQSNIQATLNQVQAAHNHTPSYKPLIVLQTKAPWFAQDPAERTPTGSGCENVPGYPGDGAAIDAGYASDYGDAARTLMFCLKDVDGAGKCPFAPTTPNMLSWVQGIELGNEPNSHNWWQNGQNAITKTESHVYSNAARSAALKIHAWSPSLDVSTAGLSYGNPDGNGWGEPSVDATEYLLEFLLWSVQYGGMDIDAVGIHPYAPGIHPTFDANDREMHLLADVEVARQALAWLGGSSTPLWITEVGADADCNNNGNPPPCSDDGDVKLAEEQRQAADLHRIWGTVKHVCGDYNVTLAVFWTLSDNHPYGEDPNGAGQFYAGFMKNDFSPKVAYDEFSTYHYLSYNNCG
jgi:hypothetical protein